MKKKLVFILVFSFVLVGCVQQEISKSEELQEVQEKLQDSQIELMEKRMEVYGLRQELLRSQEAMDALKEKVHAALLLSLSALLQ